MKTFRATQAVKPEDPENEMVLEKDDILEQQEDENYQDGDDYILCLNKRTEQLAYVDIGTIEEVKDQEKPDLGVDDVNPAPTGAPTVTQPVALPPAPVVDAPPAPKFTPSADADADSFKDLFEKHEQYFKAVAEKRDESFKKLADAIQQAQSEISACRERNQKIRSQIRELDDLIDQERNKWKERLEVEKGM